MESRDIQQSIDDLIQEFSRLTKTAEEQALLAHAVTALDEEYSLGRKIAREPGVAEIVKQMVGRIYRAYRGFTGLSGKKILDIACGSNTSKAPPDIASTPFGRTTNPAFQEDQYTALFEPWFCRMLLEFGADPVGIDLGSLEGETFKYFQVDLGQPGALDFLPDQSFDAVQDSRLFGSPEFTAQYPDPADRARAAEEIWRQEQRVLKPDGIVIHSDAAVLLRKTEAGPRPSQRSGTAGR